MAEDYQINSRMTLGEALPAGTTVSILISVNGSPAVPYITDVTIPGTQFWITDLIPGSVAAAFDAGYGGRIEVYAITITSGGGNPAAIDTTVKIESIISEDDFTTNTVLADITLPVHLDADEAAALALVQDQTTLTGDLAALTATFPAAIPAVIVAEDYQINSRMTLGEALPAGTTVSILISVNGSPAVPYVTDVTIPGTQFWITDLIPGSVAANFDAGYGGRIEVYAITITSGGGNPATIDTTVKIESIISEDDFTTNTVLADITLPVHLDADEAAALALVQDQTTLTGDLAALTATFPAAIPAVIVAEDYQINSRMTLGEALPAGTTVSILISVNGSPAVPYVTDVTIPGTQFWITDLIPGSVAAAFDAGYGGRIEVYAITITSGGGNPATIDTTVKIESIISEDDFTTNTVLADITLPVHLDADEAAALALVQDQTTLTGDLAALTATFPAAIPAVIVAEDYQINSRMTLGEALPAGTTVSILISVNGSPAVPYVTDVTIPGTQFWITDLIPGSVAAAFDAGYGGRIEVYAITITSGGGNPAAIDTTVKIESIISEDDFTTNTVLADITLPVHIDADEAAALALVQDQTTLTGDLAALTATFPAAIPAVIVAEDYQINSRMTLGEALPAGTTVSILISVNGSPAVPYVTDVTIPGTQFWITDLIPGSVAAAFDAGYGGRIEVYAITITSGGGNPAAIDTTVKIESIIYKDSFATEVILDEITLPVVVVAAPGVTIDASQLFWDDVSGATGYKVYESTTQPYCGPADAEIIYSVPAPGYTLPTDTSHNYYYFVRTVNGTVESADSNRVGKFSFQLVPGQ